MENSLSNINSNSNSWKIALAIAIPIAIVPKMAIAIAVSILLLMSAIFKWWIYDMDPLGKQDILVYTEKDLDDIFTT